MKVAILTTDDRGVFADHKDPIPRFGTAPAALLQGFEKFPDEEIHVISCSQRQLRAPEKIAANIWFHGLHVPKIGWLRTGYQGCIRAVRHKLKQIGPDIVHGQGTERDCAISAIFSGYPNVITIHGNMRVIAKINHARPFTYEWFAARLESLTLPRSNGVICITDYTRKAVEHLAQKTWVLPNAVDANFFQVERKLSASPLILCVGHVTPRKNQNFFIRALDELKTTIDLSVIFLGAASSHSSYAHEFFALLAQRPWCRHEGFVGRDQLKSYLARTSVVVLPSLEDNCPMIVLEGMATGVPVVAANVGGVPELIVDRVTGLFCAPHDAQSIRDGIATYLQDPIFAEKISRRAKEEALARFLPERIAAKHLEIYREVLQINS